MSSMVTESGIPSPALQCRLLQVQISKIDRLMSRPPSLHFNSMASTDRLKYELNLGTEGPVPDEWCYLSVTAREVQMTINGDSKVDDAYDSSRSKGYAPFVTARDLDRLTMNPGNEPD